MHDYRQVKHLSKYDMKQLPKVRFKFSLSLFLTILILKKKKKILKNSCESSIFSFNYSQFVTECLVNNDHVNLTKLQLIIFLP